MSVKIQQFDFGGVDSRSNPCAYPRNRALRCRNYVPDPSGVLQLRYGYSEPTMSTVTATAVHSAAYFEQYNPSTQYLIYGQGTAVKRMDIASGDIQSVGTLSNGNQWGHFRARSSFFFANGTDFKQYDGSIMRDVGIRAPNRNGLEGAGSTLTDSTAYASTSSTSASSYFAMWFGIGGATGAPDGDVAPPYDTYANSDNLGAPGAGPYSDLVLGSFGLAVPTTNSTVKGITFNLRVFLFKESQGTRTVGITVYARRGGSIVGAGKYQEISYTGNWVTLIYGAVDDLWNDGAWTPANVNVSDFDFLIHVDLISSSGGASDAYVLVDSGQVSVRSQQDSAGVVAAFTSNTNGSWSTTALSGYQMYMAYYNPFTGHVGNAVPVGSRLTNPTNTTMSLSLTALSSLAAINSEWVKGFGRTLDGGQIPYWLVDTNGDRVVAANAATSVSILLGTVDTNQELPSRNDVPIGLHYFARANNRIFALDDTEKGMWFSEDDADLTGSEYVGNPEESWPRDNFAAHPTGEKPTAIHGIGFEVWLFSFNYLAIWSTVLQQQAANPWRGPWPTGCAGQRAFTDTPYGPHWLTPGKDLHKWEGAGPVHVSSEYEVGLLSKIADQYVSLTEIGCLHDPENTVDKLYVLGFDANGDVVFVVHDFILRDNTSPFGQGYESVYTGITPNTFVGAGFTPRQNTKDANMKERLWIGVDEGQFAQIEDGSTSDGGDDYVGDYIILLNLGAGQPIPQGLQITGDEECEVSYSLSPDDAPEDYKAASPTVIDEANHVVEHVIDNDKGQPRHLFLRVQLESHPADGDFDIGDPPFSPMPTYGRINGTALRIGTGEPGVR